jgi:geranylgeranyl pyrophosphate synthase
VPRVGTTQKSEEALEEAITALLPTEKSPLFKVAHSHFSQFGKLLRGRTAWAVSEAVTLSPACAQNWAVSIELMHNASLVHDDICDRDEHRRHHSTVFSSFGTPLAICFGDWLVARSFEAAYRATSQAPSAEARAAVPLLASSMINLSEGQAAEFTGKPILTWEAYDQVVAKKTIPLILTSITGPLLLAGADRYLPPAERASHAAGLAFQMANDMLDVLGQDGSAAAFNDLRRRAPNAVTVSFRSQLLNSNKAAFDAWMATPADDDIQPWVEQMLETSALEICTARLQEQLNICRQECDVLPVQIQSALTPLVTYLEHATTSVRARATDTARICV